MKRPKLLQLVNLARQLLQIRRTRKLPTPDTKGALGRRYDSPEQGHAPPDAPHIADDGKL